MNIIICILFCNNAFLAGAHILTLYFDFKIYIRKIVMVVFSPVVQCSGVSSMVACIQLTGRCIHCGLTGAVQHDDGVLQAGEDRVRRHQGQSAEQQDGGDI